jgi:hypothetical protein
MRVKLGRLWLWLLGAGFFLLCACQPADPAVDFGAVTETPNFQPLPSPSQTLSPPAVSQARKTPTLSPTPQADFTPSSEPAGIPLYNLAAEYDAEVQQLHVQQVIQTANPAPGFETLLLVMDAARRSGVVTLHNLEFNGTTLDQITQDGVQFSVKMPPVLANDLHWELQLEYTLQLPPGPARLGYTTRQVNFGDWYFILPPYDPLTGWQAYAPFAVGEYLLNEITDFTVTLTLKNVPQEWILAASSSALVVGDTYTFNFPGARSFAWSLSPDYEVLEYQSDETKFLAYVFPEHVQAGQAALEAAVNAYKLYEQTLGEMHLESLTLVESQFLDGMEYAGLFFLGQEYFYEYAGSPRSYLVMLAAHETAHQWFYNRVGSNHAMSPWLDESLCTYLENLFYESYYPDLVDWWWQYRVLRFAPTGWVNSTIYDHSTFRSYVDAVYLRGALWMDDLRLTVGDKRFWEGMRLYYAHHNGSIATEEDFFASLLPEGLESIRELYSVYFQAP